MKWTQVIVFHFMTLYVKCASYTWYPRNNILLCNIYLYSSLVQVYKVQHKIMQITSWHRIPTPQSDWTVIDMVRISNLQRPDPVTHDKLFNTDTKFRHIQRHSHSTTVSYPTCRLAMRNLLLTKEAVSPEQYVKLKWK